jgi:DNA polymerase
MKQYIKFFNEAGCTTFIENKSLLHADNQNNETDDEKVIMNTSSRTLADSAKTLEELREYVKNFSECDLQKTAINTVFADGNPDADVMFIGEAPGATEDQQGIPFCGRSGKLLDNIIKSIGLNRTNSYITNTVFWRPPANRRPTSGEINICKPFVEKHIYFAKPKVIVLVGNTAVESLLSSNVSMHDLRAGNFTYTNKYLDHEIPIHIIFHPSYLLRQPYKKSLMWQDIIKLQNKLAI